MIRYIVSGLVLAFGVWLAIFLLSGARVTNDEQTVGTRVTKHDRGNMTAVEPSPFPSPTRENVHLSISRLDETWTILNDINSEERHRLSFAEIVPVLGVPGTRMMLARMNREEEQRRLSNWAELNPDHRNSIYGPYSHMLGLAHDPEWYNLLTPSSETIELLNQAMDNGFNSTLLDEPIPYFPTGPPPSLRNVPYFRLPNPFLDLPSNSNLK